MTIIAEPSRVRDFPQPKLLDVKAVQDGARAQDVNGLWYKAIKQKYWEAEGFEGDPSTAPRLILAVQLLSNQSEVTACGTFLKTRVLTTKEQLARVPFGAIVTSKESKIPFIRVPGGLRNVFDERRVFVNEVDPLLPVEVVYDPCNNQ